jgi:hypothetical protein
MHHHVAGPRLWPCAERQLFQPLFDGHCGDIGQPHVLPPGLDVEVYRRGSSCLAQSDFRPFPFWGMEEEALINAVVERLLAETDFGVPGVFTGLCGTNSGGHKTGFSDK